MDIHQGLAEFFRRLEAAPPAANAQEALQLVCRLVEEVEDEYCPLPRQNPPPAAFTGRMYAPQPDMIKPAALGALQATTRRHSISCGADGRIVIRHRLSQSIVFTKHGKVT